MSLRLTTTLAAALMALLCLSACEEMVDPILESDRNFTLFGTLDMLQDTQFVRVIPIRAVLDPGPAEPLDVRFTSEDLVTGLRTTWRDSIIFFNDGTYGHVFYAPLRLRAGHTYRIEIETPGIDAVTSVETTVPPQALAAVQPPILTGNAGIPLATQNVQWDGISWKPFRTEIWYRFLITESGPFHDVKIPYEPQQTAGPGDEWLVTLDLRKDRITLDTLVSIQNNALSGLALQVTMLDAAFVPPGGVFDPEVLVQPGTFSNVTNGFGFVGSVARYSTEWLLTDEVARRLGYLTITDLYGPSVRAQLEALRREYAHPGHHPGLQ